MKFYMFTVIFKQFKVFFSIICNITIYMMHYFIGFKITPKVFFYDKAGMKNVSLTITKRMFILFNKNISSRFFYTTFPIRVVFSRQKTMSIFWTWLSFFKFSIRRIMLTFSKMSFSSIKLWMPFFKSYFKTLLSEFLNLFFTSFIYTTWHFTSKIKAAFGGLKETVMFPHLRRRIIEIKNLFPLSDIILSQTEGLSR